MRNLFFLKKVLNEGLLLSTAETESKPSSGEDSLWIYVLSYKLCTYLPMQDGLLGLPTTTAGSPRTQGHPDPDSGTVNGHWRWLFFKTKRSSLLVRAFRQNMSSAEAKFLPGSDVNVRHNVTSSEFGLSVVLVFGY